MFNDKISKEELERISGVNVENVLLHVRISMPWIIIHISL